MALNTIATNDCYHSFSEAVCMSYVCHADSILTSSTDRDMRAVDQFGVRSNTKLERSSEKTRPTVNKVMVDQSKSRSLDTAVVKQARSLDTSAVKQARLPVDGMQSDNSAVDVERGVVPMASGKGDRQSLKQLVIDRVSLSLLLFGFLVLVLVRIMIMHYLFIFRVFLCFFCTLFCFVFFSLFLLFCIIFRVPWYNLHNK